MERTGIQRNLEGIRDRIAKAAHRAGRKPGEIRLVGVTKTVSPDRIAAVVEAGLEILGENYVQEAQKKQERNNRRYKKTPRI